MSDRILNLFAPDYCLSCGSAGELVCNICVYELAEMNTSVCYRCNKLTQNNQTCRSCRSLSPIFSVDWVTEYKNTAKKLIAESKFDSSRSAIRIMADLMSQEIPFRDIDVVCSVPTASKRVRQRGFDHAEMLAKRYSYERHLPFRNLLKRRSQVRQFGADRITRKQQLKGVFEPRQKLFGEVVLLVDDVISTGATIEEAAKTLKRAGAKRIHIAVFSRNK